MTDISISTVFWLFAGLMAVAMIIVLLRVISAFRKTPALSWKDFKNTVVYEPQLKQFVAVLADTGASARRLSISSGHRPFTGVWGGYTSLPFDEDTHVLAHGVSTLKINQVLKQIRVALPINDIIFTLDPDDPNPMETMLAVMAAKQDTPLVSANKFLDEFETIEAAFEEFSILTELYNAYGTYKLLGSIELNHNPLLVKFKNSRNGTIEWGILLDNISPKDVIENIEGLCVILDSLGRIAVAAPIVVTDAFKLGISLESDAEAFIDLYQIPHAEMHMTTIRNYINGVVSNYQ